MLPATATTPPTERLGEGPRPSPRLRFVVRNAVAIAFWLYTIINTFVINIDSLILRVIPDEHMWILDLKFLFFLGGAALVLITLDRASAAKFFSWVIFYPLIALFWQLPKALLRIGSWSLALGLLNAAVSSFCDFRYRVISLFVYLLCFTVVVASNHPPIMLIASLTMLSIMLVSYYRAVRSVFSPNILFQVYSSVFSIKRGVVAKSVTLDEDVKGVPVQVMTSDQLKKWSDKLGQAVLFNRLCLFAAKKLQLFPSSGFALASGAMSVIFLIVITTVSFGALNYSLYKIMPTVYETSTQTTLFTFIFYSFNALVNNFIKEIVPVGWPSHSLWMTEALCAVAIFVLFAAHFIMLRTQKYADQLAATATALEEEGRIVEGCLSDEWKLASIEDAITELERLKSDMLTISLWLTKQI